MEYNLLGSAVHGISQARILEWVAISFSKGSSWPRDRTHVSCIGGQILYCCTIREPRYRMCENVSLSVVSHPQRSHGLQPSRLLRPWDFPGKSTGVGCHCLLRVCQSCLTLCNPMDCSSPGSPIPGILQARTLEWGAISFSNTWKWKVKVKSFSRVWPSATPWTAAF